MCCFKSTSNRAFCIAWLLTASLPIHVLSQANLISTGSTWQFRAGTSEASSPVSAWRELGFNIAEFSDAAAPFWYGDVRSGGTQLTNMRYNYSCFFLRRTFVVEDASDISTLTLSAFVDDGLVAWINGVEVLRVNISTSDPTYQTFAANQTVDPAVVVNYSLPSPAGYLVEGTNILAVQVFNQDLTSSDIGFDCALSATIEDSDPPSIQSINPAAGATVGELTSIEVTFTESVQGVNAEDLLINGQPAGGMTQISGTTYSFSFTQPLPGTVGVTWDSEADIFDLSGTPFDVTGAGASWNYTLIDTKAPAIGELTPVAGATVSQLTRVEVTFDEPVLGVGANDLLVNGQAATSVTGSGAGPYLFQFPQPVSGTVQLAWSAGHGIIDASPAHNAFAGGNWILTLNPSLSTGDVIINEFAAANLSGLLDEDGEAQDWIEIYNRGSTTVNLLGWSLTDDQDTPGKWVFPSKVLNPGEYLVIFASGKDRRSPIGSNKHHTNFKLNPFGEHLALFNPESPRVASTEFAGDYPEQRNNYSYGLINSNDWRYFQTPTPGTVNGTSTIVGVVPPPHFSVERGMFDAPFTLLLISPLTGATIRYTTDGSEPGESNGTLYSGSIAVSDTTTLRAVAFKTGYLPSRTRTHSYIFLNDVLTQPNNPVGFPSNWGVRIGYGFSNNLVPADYEMDMDPLRTDPNNPASAIDPAKLQRLKDGLRDLPVVSVVMKTDDMFGAGSLHVDWSKTADVEKPCSVEMLLQDGATAFTTECGISMHGNASRQPEKNPKHGFKLSFRGDYGETKLNYRLFPDSPAEEFDDLILRADFGTSWRHWSDLEGQSLGGFQRTRGTRTRDAWYKNTLRDMGHVASHSRYCHLFINGLYWGTYDFTEQPNANFAPNYYGGEKEDFDIWEQGALKSGTATFFNEMTAITGLADNSQYELMKQYLDATEHIDYLLMHFFIGHEDWGGTKNWYAIRKRVNGPEGTFKYIPWDGENLLLNENVDRDKNPGSYGYPSGLHTKLVENSEYRLDFADRVFKHMIAPGGALTEPANVTRWNKWLAVMDKAIVAESCRWGDYRRDVHPYLNGTYQLYTRENHWLAESNRVVHSYLPNRAATVLAQFRRDGWYPSIDAPLFNQHGGRVASGFQFTLSAPAGTIYFTTNGVDPRVYGTGAVSPGASTYTSPVTLTGTTTVKARARSGSTWSALNEVIFTVGELGLPIRFSEIMYNPPGGDAYEFLELLNIGSTTIDLGVFSFEGLTYIFPVGTVIQPGATLVLGSDANTNAFHARYPTVSVAGYFGGSLANGGERIALLDRDGNTVTSVRYDDENGWPLEADGGGASLEIIDPRGDPNAPANWRTSTLANGTPGLPPVPPTALGDVVLNEIMADNLTAVTNAGTLPDWVEIHNRGGSPVSLAGWSLTDDSDARKFVLPTGTTLSAGEYLVIWCDDATNSPGLHAGFNLGRNGESVFLYGANTNRVDGVTFGLQIADLTIGRITDEWQLTVPTPGFVNSAVALASVSNLTINEWMANPLAGEDDWLELYNRSASAPVALKGIYLSTSNSLFQLNALSFLSPHGHVQLHADESDGADHVDFKLPAAGGAIALADATGFELERITYGSQIEGVSEGRLPDGNAGISAFVDSVSPGASNYLLNWNGPILNEVLARNQRAVLTPWGNYADYVEIINPGGSSVDLGGMALGRSMDDKDRWYFQTGTILGAGQTLLIWCDNSRAATSAPGSALNTGFALSGSSGDVVLFNAIGQPVDWVSYGFQISDLSIGLNGGEWTLLSTPTPGIANAGAASLGAVSALRINEWMADPTSGDDWFELYNTVSLPINIGGLYLSDHPSSVGITNNRIAPLSFIDGSKWVKFVADGKPSAGRDHVSFSLDALGETLRLYNTNLSLIDVVDFGLQSTNTSQGRLPDGAAIIDDFPATPTPEDSNYLPLTNVVINEVLTHTDDPLEDAVEFFNPTLSAVNIGGWNLSDSQSDLKRYRIPDGTLIPAGGYRVFYQYQFGPADGETDTPPLFTFNSAHGDAVYLSEVDGAGNLTGYRVGLNFGAAANGVSVGRYPTSVGVDFTAMSQHTFGVTNPASVTAFRAGAGGSNANPLIGPVVINELMYHPAQSDTNDLDVADDEFVELHNLTDAAVRLYDDGHPTNVWRLASAVDFDFPTSTTIPPNGYLVVVPFDPLTNAAALTRFQSRYGTDAMLVGPYSGKLDNAGDTVELHRPDTPQAPPHADAGFVPYLLVDRVAYSDLAPWPTAADGGGASLQREVPGDYGNDPINWKAELPTAGRANSAGADASPWIMQPPQSLTVVAGQPADFNVIAGGTAPLAYQWLHNNSPLPGQSASILLISSVDAEDAGEYRVLVTNHLGSVLSSPPAILTVLVPPSITTSPLSQSAVAGSSVLFTVTAGGTEPLHYQWQMNSRNMVGQNGDTLALNNVQPSDSTTYRVIVTNVAGSATSAAAMLTVQSPPTITLQPQGGYALLGSELILTTSATGDAPLSYQWRFNGVNLPGATGSTLHLTSLQESDSGSYTVWVTNPAGSVLSDAAVITVIPAPELTAPHYSPDTGFTCLLTGRTNFNYVIEISSNMVSWVELSTVSHTNPVTPIIDTNNLGITERYYRVRPE